MNCDSLYERANLACLAAREIHRVALAINAATARCVAYSTTPATWREAARQLAAFDQPDARAASDAAMMLAQGRADVAVVILATMRGLTTEKWVETMQAEKGDG